MMVVPGGQRAQLLPMLLIPMAVFLGSWSACEVPPQGPTLCDGADAGGDAVAEDTILSAGGCIEFIKGTLPIVISVPHGGYETPAAIPDRTEGVTVTDSFTLELGREIHTAFSGAGQGTPWMIINRLDRVKLDPNRSMAEGAEGNAVAELEWQAYHGFIKTAMATIRDQGDVGFYIDLHGQGHDPGRTQLGFSTTSTNLELSDETLNTHPYPSQSSLIPFLEAGIPFATLLRGNRSLGHYLESRGHAVVPSPTHPAPGDVTYWNTGYSSYTHGPLQGVDWMSSVLFETSYAGVRDTAENRKAFAEHLAQSLVDFMAPFENVRPYPSTLGSPDTPWIISIQT